MTLTRAIVEGILIKRCGALMTACGLDGVTNSGINSDLNDPIAFSLKLIGNSVTNLSSVSDSDLSNIESNDEMKMIDIAEYRLLITCLNSYNYVDISVGSRSERYSQIADRLEKRIKSKKEDLNTIYGIGAGTLEAGHIALDFVEHDYEEMIEESE